MNIQQTIFRWLKKRQLKQTNRTIVFPKFKDIRTVVILYEEGTNTTLPALKLQLEQSGKIVKTIGYEPKKDFNIWGMLKQNVKGSLPTDHFDLLIDLSEHYMVGAQYIDLTINAALKTGKRFDEIDESDQQGILDLMVNCKPHETGEQIIHFLKMINQ